MKRSSANKFIAKLKVLIKFINVIRKRSNYFLNESSINWLIYGRMKGCTLFAYNKISLKYS